MARSCSRWRRAWPASLVLGLAACAEAPPFEPVSLLLVTVDTLRADHLGCYGGPFETRAIDALAAEGVLVEQVLTPTPTTAPAHASLFTGRYPWHHRVLENGDPFENGPTLAEQARGHGLRTAAFVSSYVLHQDFGFGRGFEHYSYTGDIPEEPDDQGDWYARGEVTTGEALAWLREHADAPFFAWIHYFDPHLPYDPPKPLYIFADDHIDLEGKELPTEVHGVEDWATLRELIRRYRGEVRYVDAQVSRLVGGLRELQLTDRIAVVLTADHGEGLGDHGILAHGRNLHEELVRVPLIVRAPGLPPGRRLTGPAQLEDLYATLVSLIGADPVSGIDGRDLLPWLRGIADASPRDVAFGRRRRYEGEPALYYERRGQAKWIGSLDGAGTRYDLAADPKEREGRPEPDMPGALRARIAEASTPEPPRQPISETERRALEALGYVRPDAP